MPLRSAQEAIQILVVAGFSQASIADRAKVAQPTISRIWSGVQKDTRGSVLIKLNKMADEVAPVTAED